MIKQIETILKVQDPYNNKGINIFIGLRRFFLILEKFIQAILMYHKAIQMNP